MPDVIQHDMVGRRAALQRSADLAALADRLSKLADPVLEGPVYIPEQKALLSQDGGVCPADGSRLTFDPLSPHRHCCPRCGSVEEGPRHHRAWIWRHHLWLSERAIHLAILEGLGVVDGAGTRARDIIAEYVARYRSYPNADNVLGPTRLFFSTYQESIWLIQIVIAASLVDWSGEDRGYENLLSVIGESSDLIASFHEGQSNRQVWNSAALVAAGMLLDERGTLRTGMQGIDTLLTHAVSDSGWWHEGENYHFFALRGFALAAELMRTAGRDLYGESLFGERLGRMYLAPLQTLLPDLTVPARGDSPFAVSVRQPRFAELWEIGWARTRHPSLANILTALYGDGAEGGDDTGFAELAEVEQNHPARLLSRTALSWKALLWMEERRPEGDPKGWHVDSVVVRDRGPAILRSDGTRYVSLECGGTGSGHGHPDQLHLTLYWAFPWQLDFGTGSYVARSLHWYRSALAHNAPGVMGVGQDRGEGWCAAFDARGDWGWCRGELEGTLGRASRVARSVIAGPEYVLDVVDVEVATDCVVDLPIHVLSPFRYEPEPPDQTPVADEVGGPVAHEGGYDAVSTVRQLTPAPIRLQYDAGNHTMHLLVAPRSNESWLVMEGAGPPTLALAEGDRHRFVVRRGSGAGRWVQFYTLEGHSFVRVRTENGAVHLERSDGSWDTVSVSSDRVIVTRGSVEIASLGGRRPRPAPPRVTDQERVRVRCELIDREPSLRDYFAIVSTTTEVALGAANYRRSETEYAGQSALSARVAVATRGRRLFFGVAVRKPDLWFRHSDDADPMLDNEIPDIHSDGVQVYAGLRGWDGFVVVPDPDGDSVRVRPVSGTRNAEAVTGTWMRTSVGYTMLLGLELEQPLAPGDQLLTNVVVNEMCAGRSRRSGQLVLSGGGGWVYLRGDRESPENAAIAEVG